jgi:ribonuclease Z
MADIHSDCSILLQTPDGHMMLDCGDGTYGQLARRFGERTEDALRQLKCIFISHAHFDHHLGLISLLRKRRRVSRLIWFIDLI